METLTDILKEAIKIKKLKHTIIQGICPKHAANGKQEIIITEKVVWFGRCYCQYKKQGARE